MTKREKMFLSILEFAVMESKREFEEASEKYKQGRGSKAEYFEAYRNYQFDIQQLQNYKNKVLE